MEWAGMNALTASTWINQPGMFLFSAQLMGGGEILRFFILRGRLYAEMKNIPLEMSGKRVWV